MAAADHDLPSLGDQKVVRPQKSPGKKKNQCKFSSSTEHDNVGCRHLCRKHFRRHTKQFFEPELHGHSNSRLRTPMPEILKREKFGCTSAFANSWRRGASHSLQKGKGPCYFDSQHSRVTTVNLNVFAGKVSNRGPRGLHLDENALLLLMLHACRQQGDWARARFFSPRAGLPKASWCKVTKWQDAPGNRTRKRNFASSEACTGPW